MIGLGQAAAKTGTASGAVDIDAGRNVSLAGDIVIKKADGVWVEDVEGKRYIDFLAAYSAVNQGHCHPRLLAKLQEQAARVTLTSRAFRNDQLPLFVRDVARLVGGYPSDPADIVGHFVNGADRPDDNRTLATGRAAKAIDIWDVQTGKRRETWKPTVRYNRPDSATILDLVLADNGRTLISESSSGIGQRWALN